MINTANISRFCQGLEAINEIIGRSLAWLTAVMAVVVFAIVALRTFSNLGSIAVQESVTYMHAMVFMLCLAYTAKHGGHVRVDIVYRKLNREQQAWINALGGILFLLPFALFMLFISWEFTLQSWRIGENSMNTGGIPALFLLKTLVPLAGLLLAIQALADILRSLITITFREQE